MIYGAQVAVGRSHEGDDPRATLTVRHSQAPGCDRGGAGQPTEPLSSFDHHRFPPPCSNRTEHARPPWYYPLPGPWRRAIFVHRPNRFVVHAPHHLWRRRSPRPLARPRTADGAPRPGEVDLAQGRRPLPQDPLDRRLRGAGGGRTGLLRYEASQPAGRRGPEGRRDRRTLPMERPTKRSDLGFFSVRLPAGPGRPKALPGGEGGSRGSRRAWPASPTPSPPEGRGTCGSWLKWPQRLDTVPPCSF